MDIHIKNRSETEEKYDLLSSQLLKDEDFQTEYRKMVDKTPAKIFRNASELAQNNLIKKIGYYHWRFIGVVQKWILALIPQVEKKVESEKKRIQEKRASQQEEKQREKQKVKKMQEQKKRNAGLGRFT